MGKMGEEDQHFRLFFSKKFPHHLSNVETASVLKREQTLLQTDFRCFYITLWKSAQIKSPCPAIQICSASGLQQKVLQKGKKIQNPCCLMQKACETLGKLPGVRCVTSSHLNSRHSVNAPSGQYGLRNHMANFKHIISDFSKALHEIQVPNVS